MLFRSHLSRTKNTDFGHSDEPATAGRLPSGLIISNYVLDMVLNGNRQSVQFLIFSQKYDEIADRIIHDLGRGCTILDGEGGYSRKPVKVVVLLAKKSESVSIFRIVKRIDHQAFISQSIVRGVYGEGFDQIKT